MAQGRPFEQRQDYHNYIGGEWVPSVAGETFENINPADTRDVVGRFPVSTTEDVERAVEAAAGAFNRWRRTPAPRRAEILFRLGEILIRNKERFSADMTREMGKVLKETGGDVQKQSTAHIHCGEGRRLHRFTTPARCLTRCDVCRQPAAVRSDYAWNSRGDSLWKTSRHGGGNTVGSSSRARLQYNWSKLRSGRARRRISSQATARPTARFKQSQLRLSPSRARPRRDGSSPRLAPSAMPSARLRWAARMSSS